MCHWIAIWPTYKSQHRTASLFRRVDKIKAGIQRLAELISHPQSIHALARDKQVGATNASSGHPSGCWGPSDIRSSHVFTQRLAHEGDLELTFESISLTEKK